MALTGQWHSPAHQANARYAYRVHRYVVGDNGDTEAVEALGGFRRFPSWMWRNADVLDFVGWLKSHNELRPRLERAGFFGLDLYSLYGSIEAVIAYLETVIPAAAERYGCFDRFCHEPAVYAHTVGSGLSESCRREVLAQLLEMQREAFGRVERDRDAESDQELFAAQNAYVVSAAEEYCRTMLDSRRLRGTFAIVSCTRRSNAWPSTSSVRAVRARGLSSGPTTRMSATPARR